MEHDSIYEQLKELLSKSGGSYSILEEQIDVELQVEFFEIVNRLIKKKRKAEKVISDESKLYDEEITDEEKKRILVELSNTDKPEAYRIIERFVHSKNKTLNSWAVLAQQHGRIGLESHLLDEQQVFISTGLGGSTNKLRYFIVGKLKTGKPFTNTQRKVINTEFEASFTSFHSVIEKLSFSDEYFTILGLIPIETSIGEVITKSIEESNQYGDFIHKDYLVTNVKILKMDEIIRYFKKKGI